MSYEYPPYLSKAWIRTEGVVNYFSSLRTEKKDHVAVQYEVN